LASSPLFIGILIAYGVICVVIGLIRFRSAKSLADFQVAGRSLGPYVVATSFVAASASGVIFMGGPGIGFAIGPAIALIALAVTLAAALLAPLVMGPRLHVVSQKFQLISIPEFIDMRFGRNPLVKVLAVISIIGVCYFYSVPQVIAGAKFLQAFAGVDFVSGLLITIIWVTIYTAMSGYMATAWIDFLHAHVIAAAMLLTAYPLFVKAGGFVGIHQGLNQINPQFTTWHGMMTPWMIIGFVVAVLVGYGFGQPHMLAKYYALKDTRRFRQIVVYLLVIFSLTVLPMYYMGSGYRVLLTEAAVKVPHPDFAGPLVAQHFLPQALTVLFGLGVMAAITSTLSAFMMVTSASLARDLYQGLINPRATDRQVLRASRVLVVLWAVLVTSSVFWQSELIVMLALLAITLDAATVAPVMLFSLYWRRATAAGVATSMVLGFTAVLGWYLLGRPFGIHEVFPGLLVSVGGMVLVSRFTPPPPEKVVESFFSLFPGKKAPQLPDASGGGTSVTGLA